MFVLDKKWKQASSLKFEQNDFIANATKTSKFRGLS